MYGCTLFCRSFRIQTSLISFYKLFTLGPGPPEKFTVPKYCIYRPSDKS